MRWEADERPEPRSLGLLPSGPDPVGEWLVHRQPPAPISAQRNQNASGEHPVAILRATAYRYLILSSTGCSGCCMSDSRSSSLWELHPHLARDTVAVGDLPLSRILVMNDANYPWLLLVPRQPGLIELIDLKEPDRVQLIAEISQVGRGLKAVAQCDKLNIAAIGNLVPQLHIHVVARRRTDVAWPKPVWGLAPPRAYVGADLDRLVETLHRALIAPSLDEKM
jgi:diadenosine tetraphosphate (Ap4A) HIT family hydrolase